MFYQDHEKRIYRPPGADTQYDPLALDRALTIASSGKLNEILTAWSAVSDGLGDVSQGSKEANAVLSARAEESLVGISRKAFGLPDFPDCLDATALEYLRHYLEWMEGKGETAGKPQ